MSFINVITPKDTEEVKPGLFIQKKGNGYKQVYPAAWNGKINWSNLIFGGKVISSTLFFMLILFIVWSYQHDVKTYQEFYLDIHAEPFEFCNSLMELSTKNYCTAEFQAKGLCSNLEVIDDETFNELFNKSR